MVGLYEPTAVKFSLYGALTKATHSTSFSNFTLQFQTAEKALLSLYKTILSLCPYYGFDHMNPMAVVNKFNEMTSKSEVLALLNRVIDGK